MARDPRVGAELTAVLTEAAQAAREGKTDERNAWEGRTEESQEVRVWMRRRAQLGGGL